MTRTDKSYHHYSNKNKTLSFAFMVNANVVKQLPSILSGTCSARINLMQLKKLKSMSSYQSSQALKADGAEATERNVKSR